MFGNYTYHQIIKKTIIAFGTLFNDIQIRHQSEDGSDVSLMRVPIAYGPVQKFLARLEQKPDIAKKRVALTLPRLSFEMTSLQYDTSRKVPTAQTFQAITKSGDPVKMYMPAPYNLGIQLSIIGKYHDDMLQIIEQIIPIFQPQFNLTIDLVSTIGEKRDIPIILDGISMSDEYEGDFSSRRVLIYTLNFTAKTYIFGAIPQEGNSIIKKVQVDYYTDTQRRNASRQLRYVATPRALKDYDKDKVAIILEEITSEDNLLTVSNGSLLEEKSYIMINDEVMHIKSIDSNTVYVDRAQNNTVATSHEINSFINEITEADDELIEFDDEFGFNEERFDFGDGRIYSPRLDSDL
jgi:hypothetical protein